MTTAHFFWHGLLTKYELASLKSFKDHGFDVILWSFDDFSKVLPEGIQNKDATEILPREWMEKNTQTHWRDAAYPRWKASLTLYSDMFRFSLLAKYDGWWFDSDAFCLKDVSEFEKYAKDKDISAGYHVPNESKSFDGAINCAVINFRDKGMSQYLVNQVNKRTEERSTFIWAELGPQLFTNFIREQGLEPQIADFDVFYPITVGSVDDEVLSMWSSDIRSVTKCENLCKDSLTVHWFNSILDINRKNNPIDKDSYIGKLFTSVGIDIN